MQKMKIAAIAGAMVLCLAAAGCGSQGSGAAGTAATDGAAEAAAAATTAAAAEEDAMAWQEEDDAYLSGVKASDYVDLPEDYKHMTVEAAKPVDPTDDEVEARIQTELQNRTTLQEVDREAKEGDTVSIDYVGKVDGKEFDGGTGSYDLVLGSHSFIEGFEEGLVGAKKGETLDLNLTFPENYHPEEGLDGKDVVFTVTVNKVSETVTPELTDDFVRSLNLTNAFGQAVTDTDDYKDYIRSNMIEEREATYEDTVKSQLVSKLVEGSSFKQDAPANMVEKYNSLLTRQLTYYALQSYTDLQTLMTSYYGATADNYLDMIRDMAVSYAEQSLVYQAVADEHDLNPSEDEVSTHIAEYVASDATVENVEDLDRVIRESLRDELMSDNVIDYLYDHCKVEEPKEEEEEADEAASSDTADAASTAAESEGSADADTAEAAASDTASAAETGENAGSADTSGNAADASSAASGQTAEAAGEETELEAPADTAVMP